MASTIQSTPFDEEVAALQTHLECRACEQTPEKAFHKDEIPVLKCPDCGDIKYRAL